MRYNNWYLTSSLSSDSETLWVAIVPRQVTRRNIYIEWEKMEENEKKWTVDDAGRSTRKLNYAALINYLDSSANLCVIPHHLTWCGQKKTPPSPPPWGDYDDDDGDDCLGRQKDRIIHCRAVEMTIESGQSRDAHCNCYGSNGLCVRCR